MLRKLIQGNKILCTCIYFTTYTLNVNIVNVAINIILDVYFRFFLSSTTTLIVSFSIYKFCIM